MKNKLKIIDYYVVLSSFLVVVTKMKEIKEEVKRIYTVLGKDTAVMDSLMDYFWGDELSAQKDILDGLISKHGIEVDWLETEQVALTATPTDKLYIPFTHYKNEYDKTRKTKEVNWYKED